jgi:peptidoglycan/xylan/chitin deacetylase (PgdA/CDA1 family)
MLKRVLCRLAFACGGSSAYRALAGWRRGHALRILSIHRVIDAGAPLNDADRRDLARGVLSRSEFERRIRFIGRHYRFVDLKTVAAGMKSGAPIPAHAVVLTFDDGFRDVHAAAWPILAAMHVPFAVLLTTGFVGQPGMLSREEVGHMAARGQALITWGAHGVTHRALTAIAPSEAEDEIARSKQDVERLTGAAATVFAYPDGMYNAAVRELVERQGFDAALATGRTLNWAPCDRFALTRIPFEQEPLARFAFRLAGIG